MTQLELSAYVCSHMAKRGIDVVLSGGATVSLYTHSAYLSKDVDLVNVYSAGRKSLAAAMVEIGFVEQNRYFRHPDSDYIVEFPPGPLAIGDEPVRQILDRKLSTGVLRVISPTDCVKDRLAAYYHFGDSQALRQAVLVAGRNRIDLKEVARWSQAEGRLAEFNRFSAELKRKK